MNVDNNIRVIALAVLVLLIVVAALVAPVDVWVDSLAQPERWHGVSGIALFVLLYVVWNFALPPAPLQALAGAYYGLAGGLAVIAVSTTLANAVSHGVARWLGREWVAAKIEGNERLEAAEAAIQRMGWKGVALLRLSNLIPSNIANLLMGVTALRLPMILAASLLGSIPGWILMLTLGRGGLALFRGDRLTTLEIVLYSVSGAAALALLAGFGWYARKVLNASREDA
jgi:uncharacterized membrane protein YdjX (TVP38/TMEM64 family)